METITAITEASFKTVGDYEHSMDGFIITTTEQEIKVGIDNYQSCCENWGYFMTNDTPQDFIGAELLSVDIVDEILNKEKAPELYDGSAMFVNFETSRGTLQFTAYNEHNGYYAHQACVISKQKIESEYL